MLVALPDSAEFVATFLGTLLAGAVAVPCNTFLGHGDYRYFLAESRAAVFVTTAALASALAPAIDEAPSSGGARDRRARRPRDARVGALGRAPVARRAPADTHRDAPAFWLWTSGSTGVPKAAVHLHQDWPWCCEGFGVGVLAPDPGDRLFSAAKLFHAYGLGNGLAFPFWVGATTALLPARATPDAVFDVMRRHRPTVFFGVPTLYAAVVQRAPADTVGPPRRCAWRCRPASPCRPTSTGAGASASAPSCSTPSAPPRCCTAICRPAGAGAPGQRRRAGAGLRRARSSTSAATTCPTASRASCWCTARARRSPTGSAGSRRPRRCAGRGSRPAIGIASTTRGATGTSAAPTTCSRCRASGARRPRWRRRWPGTPPSLECAVVPQADGSGVLKPRAIVVTGVGRGGRRRARRRAARVRPDPPGPLQGAAHDRLRARAAQDRHRQDPALQAARLVPGTDRCSTAHVAATSPQTPAARCRGRPSQDRSSRMAQTACPRRPRDQRR